MQNLNELYNNIDSITENLNVLDKQLSALKINLNNIIDPKGKEEPDDESEEPTIHNKFNNIWASHSGFFSIYGGHTGISKSISQKHRSDNFFSILHNLQQKDNRYKTITHEDIFALVLSLISGADKYEGYAYGGIIRDFILPLVFNNVHILDIDFKDVDIWFKSNENMLKFVEYVNNIPLVKLVQPNYYFAIEYHGFNRAIYNVEFDGVPLFYLDLNVSPRYPVDDFSSNLIYLVPKSSLFESISKKWFRMGVNKDDDHINFSVNEIIESTVLKTTTLLTEYKNIYFDNNYANMGDPIFLTVNSRINRMIERGWDINFGQNK